MPPLTRLTLIWLIFAGVLNASKIQFQGLTSYTEKDLIEGVGGRLEYVIKRGAAPYRADDAAFLVESYLHSHGLPDAVVTWNILNTRTILLTVKEGLSQYLGEITVTGHPDIEAIQDQFKAPFSESGKQRAFDANSVSTGQDRVLSLLHSQGYWDSKITAIRGTRNALGQIPFTLNITPGTPYKLAVPTLETPVPARPRLLERLQEIKGKVADSSTINNTRNTIRNSFRRQGYPDISLIMSRELDGTTLHLTFQLTPGQKYTIHSFKTEGQQKTNPARITQQFPDLIGKKFDEDKLNEKIKKLLATGAFERIQLHTKEINTNQLDLTLEITEADARGYSISGGWGSFEGIILGARYFDRNLRGSLWNFAAGAEITSLGVLGEITLTDPFFLGGDRVLSNRVYLITRDFDNYDKLQGGISTELSWKNGAHYSSSVGLELSFTTVNSSLSEDIIGPTDYLINRLDYRQQYDRRNDPNLPSDGWLARWDNTLGFATGDGGIAFYQTEAQLSYYKTINNTSAYDIGLRGGIIRPSGDEDAFPIDLRKFLGGANTIRSFPERELGRNLGGGPLGGNEWWVANAEYIYTITGPVKAIGFVDAGSLDSNLELAAGLGVRIDLPVGPIRLEYGHNLTRDSSEPSGAFHFAIGTTF